MKKKLVSLVLALTMSVSMGTECYASTGTFFKKASNSIVQSVGDAFDFVKEKATNLFEKTYTFNDLCEMSNQEILQLTKKIKWNDIEDLFEYTDGAKIFYSDRNRVDALIEGLKTKASEYTRYDDAGIDTLVELLRSGFYIANNTKWSELEYMTDRSYKDKCNDGLIAIANSSYFNLGEEGQDKVINAYGKLIGNASSNAEVVNKTVKIFNQYYDNIDEYVTIKSKSDAVYNIMKSVCYDIERYCYDRNIHYAEKTPWYKNIDEFINSVVRFAELELNSDNEWIVNNGIEKAGKLHTYHSNPNSIHKIIDNISNTVDANSSTYLVALNTLQRSFGSKDAQGNDININGKKEQKKTELLPKTYIFDDGKMVIKTGDKVAIDKVQQLYWASKEVKSQFFRFIGNDKPLEPGNADDVLTVVIYNSPEEYKNNSYLYGYSTDNGGMYIEQTGTFFTYERTPEQSIYSLEELFRHEYTHYLQGRYLVPGLYGTGDFFKDNQSRLTWFEEGTAEFFAGSTRFNVQPRSSMVGGINANNNKRLDLNSLFHSSYNDGWEFYTYGYTFADYMYNNDMGLFKQFIDTLKSNNVSGFDNIIRSESSNSRRNSSYQRHMNLMYKNVSSYGVPLVSNDYMKTINPYNLDQIKRDIEDELRVSNSDVKQIKSLYFDTFELRAKYVLGKDKGFENNFNKMNKVLNKALEDLNNKEWNGYKTVTAYFANPTIQGNDVVYDVVFHGVLNQSEDFSAAPTPIITCDNNTVINEPVKFYGDKSEDDGEIVSYLWDFGDGKTSAEINPTHKYEEIGDYAIKLTVVDDHGLKETTYDNVSVAFSFDGFNEISEKEKNNYYEDAVEIPFNTIITGDLGDNRDTHDIFEINVPKEGKYLVVLENSDKNKKGNDCHWYIMDGENSNKTIESGNYQVPQDYKTVTLDGPYKYFVTVTGQVDYAEYKFIVLDLSDTTSTSQEPKEPQQPEEPPVQKPNNEPKDGFESENNDTFDKANNIKAFEEIKGELDSSDRCDTFKIYFDKPCKAQITMKETGKTDSSTWLLYSSDDTYNYIASPTNRDNKTISGEVDIAEAGEYYIVVYDARLDNSEYTLDVSVNEKTSQTKDEDEDKPTKPSTQEPTTDENTEQENNDDFDNANKIKFGEKIIGSLNSGDRCDIFSFYADEKGTANINLELSKRSNSTAWLLYNSNDTRNYIDFSNSGNNDYAEKEVTIPCEGEYFVVVYDSYKSDLDYELTVDFEEEKQSKDDEEKTIQQPVVNEKPTKDDDINVNNQDENNKEKEPIKEEPKDYSGEFSGTLSEQNTSQIHEFTLEGEQNINITLDNPSNIGMAYMVYDSPSKDNMVAYGDSSSDASLKEGTYYVYVYIYEYKTGDYKVTIS